MKNQDPEGVSRTAARVESDTYATEALRRYQDKGRAKRYFGTGGDDAGQMNGPGGISSTADDDIVVADSFNHRIQIFDVNGQVKGEAEGQFRHVADVCVTSRGRIVASDMGNHRIQIFNEQGKLVREFGGEGSGDGKLKFPVGVATDDKGQIYVCDCFNRRVQVFSEEGKFDRMFGSDRLNRPHYLSVTANGRIVVSDYSHTVEVFDSHGRHLFQIGTIGTNESQFNSPRGIATDDHGNIIVCDAGNNRVQVFTRCGKFVSCFGSKGSGPGQMDCPTGVCLLSDGGITVSDRRNNRVQIF